jgi:hypothetical protein
VTIRQVGSGCGCAKPRLDRSILPARASTSLWVDVTPIEHGGRTIAIEVESDSPITPLLALELKVQGWRKPPYVQSILGDLTFRDDRPGTALAFEVSSLCISGDDKPLQLSCSLPCIELARVAVTRKEGPDGSHQVLRIERFEAKLASPPPDESLIGEVFVDDPWNHGRRLTLPVRFDVPPPVRVLPSRIVLNTRNDNIPSTAALLVLGREDLPEEFEVVPRNPDAPLLVVRAALANRSKRVAKYTVTLKPGISRPGSFGLIVRGVDGVTEETIHVVAQVGQDL